MTEAELVQAIAAWVADRPTGGAFVPEPVTAATDLIGAGLVDSLGMVDLLLYLEELCGARVDLTDADPSEFGKVSGLCLLVLGRQDQRT